jgi:uncharacterized glyoxalase superfamily protein PhnB
MPRISPYLYYEDVGGALQWLARAFGFRERLRLPGDDGTVRHAEMEFGGGVVLLGCPGPDYRNPRRLGRPTQSLYVYVDGIDAHFERARRAGATIVEEPGDQPYGDRRYGVDDPEGHRWYFAERVRDVAPEDPRPSA